MEVAGTTAHGAVCGQILFPEEQPPQFDAFHRERIVFGDVHRREKRRNLKGVWRGCRRSPA